MMPLLDNRHIGEIEIFDQFVRPSWSTAGKRMLPTSVGILKGSGQVHEKLLILAYRQGTRSFEFNNSSPAQSGYGSTDRFDCHPNVVGNVVPRHGELYYRCTLVLGQPSAKRRKIARDLLRRSCSTLNQNMIFKAGDCLAGSVVDESMQIGLRLRQ